MKVLTLCVPVTLSEVLADHIYHTDRRLSCYIYTVLCLYCVKQYTEFERILMTLLTLSDIRVATKILLYVPFLISEDTGAKK